MNRPPDVELVLRAYLADTGDRAPDRVLTDVADRMAREPRRPWRLRGRPFMQTYLKLAAGLAAVLVVGVVGYGLLPRSGGGSTGTPSAPPAGTPAPSSAASSVPAETPGATAGAQVPPCRPDDVSAFELRAVGGNAITTEIILTRNAADLCSVDGSPTIVLLDATGAELARTAPAQPGSINLRTDYYFHSQFRLESWCGAAAALPLSIELVLDAGAEPIAGWSVTASPGMPACAGADGSAISATKWVGSP